MKRGDLVRVVWLDIKAELHTEEDIEPVEAESVGWVDSSNSRWIRLFSSRYPKEKSFRKFADKIVIPKGCVVKVEPLD